MERHENARDATAGWFWSLLVQFWSKMKIRSRAVLVAPSGLAVLSGCLAYAVKAPTHRRRGGRVAEGGGLLNRYTVNSRIVGSNPIPSAN
jgi:hypothetical protein